MATRGVKPAFSKEMNTIERGSLPKRKVKAALTPPKEERPKKQTRKVKRALDSGR